MTAVDPIQLVVFDLDFTLWDCGTWVDCTTPPFERDANGRVTDQAGNHCRLYPDVLGILERLEARGLTLALASRTHDPEAARTLLGLLEIADRFPLQHIYPGSKLFHFELLQRESGVAYGQMLFFDDEMRNIRDAISLGIQAVQVPAGINWDMVDEALEPRP